MKKFTLISLIMGLFLVACTAIPAAVGENGNLVRIYALED